MAVVSPFVPSPGGLNSKFSPYTDSPSSPLPYRENVQQPNRTSASSDTLAPPPSPYPQHVDPSPTDSNGTESTDIEEEAQDQAEDEEQSDVDAQSSRSQSRDSLIRIDTTNIRSRSNSDEAPPSVIHVPSGFGDFTASPVDTDQAIQEASRPFSDSTSPSTPDAALGPDDRRISSMTSPLNTNVSPDRSFDHPTPRAQTRQEAEEEWKRRSRRTSSLEDIPEAFPAIDADITNKSEEESDQTMRSLVALDTEATELRTALNECWTLCNTLASLSSNHRQRMFTMSNKGSTPEQAWQTCWRLCQQLYESHDSPYSQALPTLELCREFCQALFDVRKKGDEATDSVLRVSFEMNNHLYNTHDRNLPEAFRERTLDFYITLCHRLMKQRTSLAHETDSLLRACWSLAEMLFSLRQTGREFRKPDDELLASAVQACWDLCDLFREGWSQVRPERSTPRPSQTSFPPSLHTVSSHSDRPSSSLSSSSYHDAPTLPPETPTTIFDDATTASSPDSTNIPHILVLGPSNSQSSRPTPHHDRWSSTASTLSDTSASTSTSSHHTSSTARAGAETAHLLRLRCLILKAAFNTGYTRTSMPLPVFANTMAPEAFGAAKWQISTLRKFRRLVAVDQSLASAAAVGGLSARVSAAEVAGAVVWLARSEQWTWVRELFRVVFGFGVEEAEVKGGVIQI